MTKETPLPPHSGEMIDKITSRPTCGCTLFLRSSYSSSQGSSSFSLSRIPYMTQPKRSLFPSPHMAAARGDSLQWLPQTTLNFFSKASAAELAKYFFLRQHLLRFLLGRRGRVRSFGIGAE